MPLPTRVDVSDDVRREDDHVVAAHGAGAGKGDAVKAVHGAGEELVMAVRSTGEDGAARGAVESAGVVGARCPRGMYSAGADDDGGTVGYSGVSAGALEVPTGDAELRGRLKVFLQVKTCAMV